MEFSLTTVVMGGAVSVLVTSFRAALPELECEGKGACGKNPCPHEGKTRLIKLVSGFLSPLIGALIATAVPSTVPEVAIDARWLYGIVSTLLWSPFYALFKKQTLAKLAGGSESKLEEKKEAEKEKEPGGAN